jgi:hypothetical protein
VTGGWREKLTRHEETIYADDEKIDVPFLASERERKSGDSDVACEVYMLFLCFVTLTTRSRRRR